MSTYTCIQKKRTVLRFVRKETVNAVHSASAYRCLVCMRSQLSTVAFKGTFFFLMTRTSIGTHHSWELHLMRCIWFGLYCQSKNARKMPARYQQNTPQNCPFDWRGIILLYILIATTARVPNGTVRPYRYILIFRNTNLLSPWCKIPFFLWTPPYKTCE